MIHAGLGILELDEMHLDVLAGRDVSEPARELLAAICDRAQRRGRQDALRDLDAEHLDVILALSVHASDQPECAPLFGRQFAALVASRASRRTPRCRRCWQTTAAPVPESMGVPHFLRQLGFRWSSPCHPQKKVTSAVILVNYIDD